jgi:hypothetical protein
MAQQALQGAIATARQQATAQDQYNYAALRDWRVSLSLAPGADYLYRATNPGILQPLALTDGVIFPYTPQVQVQYSANYDATEITHSNYKIFQYKSSGVDSVTITGDFTAQDTYEANYLLAVIHFFRSVTKMFYGNDQNPKNGTPPPLCYLYGLGEFQFNKHPLAITGFNYSLPNDVDYIRASAVPNAPGESSLSGIAFGSLSSSRENRTASSGIGVGGAAPPPNFETGRSKVNNTGGTVEPTYVPTKMQIQISAVPIVSRLDISSNFSLQDYATGRLLQGPQGPQAGGIW